MISNSILGIVTSKVGKPLNFVAHSILFAMSHYFGVF